MPGGFTTEQWVALLSALGVGSLLPMIVKAVFKLVTGMIGAEKRGIESAVQRADDEASKRRRVEEHASKLRRIIIENCGEDLVLPDWPIENTTPRHQMPGHNEGES